jgi:hypothetical protein
MMTAYERCRFFAWLSYFAGDKNASEFAGSIENNDKLLVPSITITEVFKNILRQRDNSLDANRNFADHQQGGGSFMLPLTHQLRPALEHAAPARGQTA